MVNLAKPGGLIFAIDLDVSIMSAADPSHPSSLRFDAARQRVNASVRVRREPAYRMGRRLPGLFEKMGLVEVSNSAWTSVTRGGSLEAEFWRLTYETWKTAWTSEGVLTIEELQLLISAMTDESFRFLDGLWFKISGRKPH